MVMNNTAASGKSIKSLRGCLLGLAIPALGVGLAWYFIFGPMHHHSELAETGTRAPGRLLSVEETGTVINDSPELHLKIEFRRADGVLDTSETDFVPSLRSLSMFQDGVGVTAAYDPKDPDDITVVDLSTGPGFGTTAPAAPIVPGLDSLRRANDSLARELERVKGGKR